MKAVNSEEQEKPNVFDKLKPLSDHNELMGLTHGKWASDQAEIERQKRGYPSIKTTK